MELSTACLPYSSGKLFRSKGLPSCLLEFKDHEDEHPQKKLSSWTGIGEQFMQRSNHKIIEDSLYRKQKSMSAGSQNSEEQAVHRTKLVQ